MSQVGGARRLDFTGDFGFGTAFAVDRGVYVTAYHVVLRNTVPGK